MRAIPCFPALIFVFAVGCRQEQQATAPPPAVTQPQEAASSAIRTFQQLVTEQNYRSLGFESVDEVQSAALGQPLALYTIGLEQLKAYRQGTDANSLLTPSADTLYPVTANGQVRSSVTVTKVEGGYRASSFGNSEVVKALSKYREAATAFAVRLPALNLYYLAQRVENKLLLTPVADDSRLKLPAGKAVPAEEVVNQLVPIANAYNGLPM
jgi:hypothetical protein